MFLQARQYPHLPERKQRPIADQTYFQDGHQRSRGVQNYIGNPKKHQTEAGYGENG